MSRAQKEYLIPFLRQAADRIEKTIGDGGLAPAIETLFASALTHIEDMSKNILDDTFKVGMDKKERRETKRKMQKESKKIRKRLGDIVGDSAEPKLLRDLANSFEAELSEGGRRAIPLGKQIHNMECNNDDEDKTGAPDGTMKGKIVAHDKDMEGDGDDDEASDAKKPYVLLEGELTSEEEEELAQGKKFYYLCSMIGIEMVFKVVDLEEVLELFAVREDGIVDPKRIHPRMITALEMRLVKMAKEEENAMEARIAEKRRELGEKDMIKECEKTTEPEATGYTAKDWHKLADIADGGDEEESTDFLREDHMGEANIVVDNKPPELVMGQAGASRKLKCRATNAATDVTKDAPAGPRTRVSDAPVPNLTSDNLAAMVINQNTQSGPGRFILTKPVEIGANLVEAFRASRGPVKKETPWDKLRRALALCEVSLRDRLVSCFEKNPDFVLNIPNYAKLCLKIPENCPPRLYDDLRVPLWANSVQRVQERMKEEKEQRSHAEPAFGRDAADDPIVRRLKTLKRGWPTVERSIEKLYTELKEGNESTEEK